MSNIDDKFALLSDVKSGQDELTQQETDYVANIAEIDDWVNNEATKRETARVNYLNVCIAKKELLEEKVLNNSSELADELTEINALIAAYETKIDDLTK
jgi:hypothetical protein